MSPLITESRMVSPEGAQPHVHGVGIPKQVVQIAQNLLIRAEEESAQVVLSAIERMQQQRALYIAAVDERVHLAVGITGDIAQHGGVCGLVLQAVDRHHGEELFDRPAIGHALK